MQWTEDQEKVIVTRNQNLLVSAAAGSGKTAVLVARIMSLLTDPEKKVNIDELLIVTFTRAAAAEMRTRIEAAIQKAREERPDDLHLARQAAIIHNAQITTIDGFCTYVIRNYGYTTGLVPGFRVADENENRLLRRDVVRNVLEEVYACYSGHAEELPEPENEDEAEDAVEDELPSEEDFFRFAETFSTGKTDLGLENAILAVYSTAISDPDPEGWIEECRRSSQGDPSGDGDAALAEYLGDVRAELELILPQARANVELCEREDGPSAYEKTAHEDLAIVESLAGCATYEEFRTALLGASFSRLSSARAKAGEDPALRDVFKARRSEIQKVVKESLPAYFPCSYTDALAIMKDNAVSLDVLLVLTKRFMRAYVREKKKKNLMDFADMEHEALRILKGPEGRTPAAKELAAHFAEVMVDEYQDSNYLQEEILTAVSRIEDGQGNYFCVGDVKQSIYRFRQARPELFMEKFHRYRMEPETGLRIDLHKNFRSGAEVIDPVNGIFRALMHESVGGIEYDDEAQLVRGAEYPEDPGCIAELMPVYVGEEDPSGETYLSDRTRAGKTQAEIRAIGTRILSMVGQEEIYDDHLKAMRKIEFRDIVILLRSTAGYAERAVRLLGQMSIPAYAESKTGYFNTLEVRTVLSFLEIVDNPQQDVPFAGVLRSAFVGLSAGELAMIRAAALERETASGGQCSLCDAARIYAEGGGDMRLRGRLYAFFEWYDLIRSSVPDTPLHELVGRILRESGYRDYAAALPGGLQRTLNLRMLVDEAAAYEESSYIGLFHFVRYIRNLEKQNVDLGERAAISEADNVVRISTIHKSKGLEFPVVFVANMDRNFNHMDINSFLLIHPSLGIASDHVDLVRRVKIPTIRAKILRSRLLKDEMGEELRVLYVALTRAKQKLILSGCIKDEETLKGSELLTDFRSGALPSGFILKAKNAFAWIIAAAAQMRKEAARTGGRELIALKPVSPSMLASEEVDMTIRKEDLLERLRGLRADEVYDGDVRRIAGERFSYRYPYAGQEFIPVEMSVSAIKKQRYEEILDAEKSATESILEVPVELIPDEYEELPGDLSDEIPGDPPDELPDDLPVPGFIRERERKLLGEEDVQEPVVLTGALKGTAYHNLMAFMDLRAFRGLDRKAAEEEVRRQKWSLVQSGKLLKEEGECIRNREIVHFLGSRLGRRMCEAHERGTLQREQPFVMALAASRLREEWPAEEEVFVQGICDAFFAEGGSIILMDYKTDRVSEAEELVRRYRAQLILYREALERATGLQVSEMIIWSFALGIEIEVPDA